MSSGNTTAERWGMSEVSSIAPPSQSPPIWKWVVYIVQGSLIFGLNMPIVATVVRHTAMNMEKQYVIISGLALADALNGFAYLAAGVYRTHLVLSGGYRTTVTAVECLLKVQNLLFVWTDVAAPLMLLVVSVDRLLSVAIPLRYTSFSRTYALRFVGAGFAYSLMNGGHGVLRSFAEPKAANKTAYCYTSTACGPEWTKIHVATLTTSAFSSILVYSAVGLIGRFYYRKRIKQLLASSNTTNSAQLKRQTQLQLKMTISLGISCFFTFALYCVPYGIGGMVRMWWPNEPGLSVYTWMLTNLNPMMNAGIYLWRHPEMRQGVFALVTNRQMPPVLKYWPQKQQQPLPLGHANIAAQR